MAEKTAATAACLGTVASSRLISVMELSGCGTALVTPFRADGAVDEAALSALVETQIDAGIELLVACGTTGEASTLTDQEWLKVIEITCSAAAGRVLVFAGCTHNSTAAAVERVHRLNGVLGLAGILSANPYYNRPGQQGQYEHFRAIAEASELPIMLYNIPGRTGANLEAGTVLRLAEMPKIVAIKESSGNLVQITELLTQLPRTFKVFCGDDALTLPVLALGGAGLISVASNVIPDQMAEMVRAALRNDWPTARRINRTFFRLMQAHFWEPSPAPVKAVMAILGMGNEAMRLPMVPVSTGTRRKLEALCGELGLMVHSEAGKVDNLRMF
jgi:4-hydroxy-tetrahydrodipicolinate synthase